MRSKAECAWRASAALVFAAAVTGCASYPSSAEIDAAMRGMDRAIEEGTKAAESAANEGAAAELARMTLPVTDHLSAVQYCAFRFRRASTENKALLDDARARSGFGPAAPALAKEIAETVDFGALYPTVRDDPYFDRKLPDRPVYLANDLGLCALLTLNEPGAAERTRAWLASPASGWVAVKARGRSPWRAYKLRNPTMLTDTTFIFEAVLSETARRAGVSAVHIVAIAGLP